MHFLYLLFGYTYNMEILRLEFVFFICIYWCVEAFLFFFVLILFRRYNFLNHSSALDLISLHRITSFVGTILSIVHE